MCLSTIIHQKKNMQEAMLCSNIAYVLPEREHLVFVDLLGRRTEFIGRIRSVDLMDNKIYVTDDTEEQA